MPDTPTVRDRLTAAGVSPESVEAHFRAGRIRVDGEPVTDLDGAAAPPARVVLAGT
jgi:hypothetical protein